MAARRKKRSNKRFIQGAIKRPGQLHADLGVPKGKTIPVAKLRAAAKRKDKVGQRARFALALRGMNKKRPSSKRKKRSAPKRRRRTTPKRRK
jgi:hypothetical protein